MLPQTLVLRFPAAWQYKPLESHLDWNFPRVDAAPLGRLLRPGWRAPCKRLFLRLLSLAQVGRPSPYRDWE